MAVDSLSTEHPIDRVLSQLQAVKRYSRGYLARCPAHRDRNPSLMLWEDRADQHVGLKCYAGCSRKAIARAIGLSEADLYSLAGPRLLPASQDGVTLLDLALDKQIHPALLVNLGLTDCTYHGREAVRIPYYTMDGKEYARSRMRTHLVAKEGSRWSEGEEPMIPYGLHRLSEARHAGYVVIVEGESDGWTLWQHGFPALGLPGARMHTTLVLDYFSGIERVYVMQELDLAGQKLPGAVAQRLKEIGYTGKIYALSLADLEGAKDPNALHKRERNAFKETCEHALTRARPLFHPGSHHQGLETASLKSLMAEILPPLCWAGPGILPEGLTLLCGKPKSGKSWFALNIGLAIASGGYALGKQQVEQGDVLYLSLEDNKRRLQARVADLLATMGNRVPDGFDYALNWPRLDQGGKEHLETWIQAHPQVRLIIVDTKAKIIAHRKTSSRTLYEEDYEALAPLKELADIYNISILVIHHLRKMGSSDDILDEISGSTGTTGGVDNLLILKRERGNEHAILHVIGRDIAEEQAVAFSFDRAHALWRLEGNAQKVQKTRERQEIVDLLQAHPDGLSARAVASARGKNLYTIRNLLKRLVETGILSLHNTLYVSVVRRSECSEHGECSERGEAAQESRLLCEPGLPRVEVALSASTPTEQAKQETTLLAASHDARSTSPQVTTEQEMATLTTLTGITSLTTPHYGCEQECCAVYEGRNHRHTHQAVGSLVQDGCGYWWCEQCQAQRDLMNWGAVHHFPSLHAGVYTIEQGRDAWLHFCQMEGFLAVPQLLAGLSAE